MAKFKVVYLDKLLPLTHYETDILDAVGAKVEQIPCASADEIIKAAADADAVMTIAAKLDRQAIDGLNRCKVIGRYGVGLDNVDIDAATEKGIVVTYVPVYCQEEVALLAVTLMLACERRIMIADRTVKSGNWKGAVAAVNGARSPRGKTFGLVGFGSIARQVVPFIKPMGLRVIAYDPYINLDFCKELGVESVELSVLLKTSD